MLSSLLIGVFLGQVRDVKLPIMSMAEFGAWYGRESGEVVIVRLEVADRDIYVNVKGRTLRELEGFVEQAVEVEFVRKNGAVTIFAAADKGDDRDFSDYYAEIAKLSQGVLDESDLEDRIKTIWPLISSINDKLSALEKLISANSDEIVSQMVTDLRADMDQVKRTTRAGTGEGWLYETLAGLGPEQLKSLGRRERVVYSTHPTKLQRSWPMDQEAQLDRVNQFCIKRNGWVGKYLPEGFDDRYGAEMRALTTRYGGDEDPVTELRLVVQEVEGEYEVEFYGFNLAGEELFQCSDTIDIGVTNDQEKFPVGLSLDLSPDDMYELQLLRIIFRDGYTSYVGNPGLGALVNLDQKNPLGGVLSRVYDFACEVTGNELVTGVYGLRNDLGEESVEARDAVAEAFQGQLAGRRNTLVVVEPRYEDRLARTYAAPKRALAEFARATLRKGFYTIDDMAGALSRIPDDCVGQQFFRVVTELDNQSLSSYPYMDILGLRLYSALSQQERALVKLERGLTLEFPNRNPALQRIFESYLISTDLNLGYTARAMDEDGNLTWLFDLTDREIEQTNLLADDRFWPAKIWLKIDSEEVFIQREANGGYIYNDEMNINRMAVEIKEMLEEKAAGNFERSQYTYSTNRKVRLVTKCNFGSLDGFESEVSMLERAPLALVTFERLPKDIQKRVMDIVERLRGDDGDGKIALHLGLITL